MARLRFGPFELDRETGELRRAGVAIRLQPQPARVLALLAGWAGRLVTREELRREIWGEDTFVDFDLSLNYCLARVRSALEDNVEAPRYVETLPRRGYRFIAPVETVRPFEQPALAVLPFANLNGDPEQDYFADGITDALITELAHVGGLRVISRQSVLHLKGAVRKMTDIGRELNVDAVLEGSALHAGDRVRITAQLVQVEPEQHLWAASHECEMRDVLALQGRVARAVAEAVAAALTPRELARLGRGAPVNPEAHLAYLKARFHLSRGRASRRRSRVCARPSLQTRTTRPLTPSWRTAWRCWATGVISRSPSPIRRPGSWRSARSNSTTGFARPTTRGPGRSG